MKHPLLPVCPVCDGRAQFVKSHREWISCPGCRALSALPTHAGLPATVLAAGAVVLRVIERLTAHRDAEDPEARLDEFRSLARDGATSPILALPEVSALARGLRIRVKANLRFSASVSPRPGGPVPAATPGVQRLYGIGGSFPDDGGIVLGSVDDFGDGFVVVSGNTLLEVAGTVPGYFVTALPSPRPDFDSWGAVTALEISPVDAMPQ